MPVHIKECLVVFRPHLHTVSLDINTPTVTYSQIQQGTGPRLAADIHDSVVVRKAVETSS